MRNKNERFSNCLLFQPLSTFGLHPKLAKGPLDGSWKVLAPTTSLVESNVETVTLMAGFGGIARRLFGPERRSNFDLTLQWCMFSLF